jgi:AcrR family transcriptional regulator
MTTSNVGPDAVSSGGQRAKRRRARPPSAHAQARELEIYQAAADIFHRKGYAATSLQDIADAVGMIKGSLYYYIDGKEDLLYGISRHIHHQANANLERSRVVEGTVRDRLEAFLEGHIMSFADNITWVRVFYTEYPALSGQRYDELLAHRHSYESYLQDLIREGQNEGLICAELDAWLTATAILTMINSVYLWFRPGRRLTIMQGLTCSIHTDGYKAPIVAGP